MFFIEGYLEKEVFNYLYNKSINIDPKMYFDLTNIYIKSPNHAEKFNKKLTEGNNENSGDTYLDEKNISNMANNDRNSWNKLLSDLKKKWFYHFIQL